MYFVKNNKVLYEITVYRLKEFCTACQGENNTKINNKFRAGDVVQGHKHLPGTVS